MSGNAVKPIEIDRLTLLACRLKGEGNIGTLGEWSYVIALYSLMPLRSQRSGPSNEYS